VLCLDAARGASDRDLLVSGSKDCEARAWCGATGACLGVAAGHVSAVTAVALARKGRGAFMVTAGADKLVKVWDLSPLVNAASDWAGLAAAGPAALRTLAAVAGHDKEINAVAVAPNDSLAATASADRTVRLWALPGLGAGLTLRGHKRGVWAVTFSPVDQARRGAGRGVLGGPAGSAGSAGWACCKGQGLLANTACFRPV
jgi:U3 small nucleolar RNA-associated protein 13